MCVSVSEDVTHCLMASYTDGRGGISTLQLRPHTATYSGQVRMAGYLSHSLTAQGGKTCSTQAHRGCTRDQSEQVGDRLYSHERTA